MDIVLAFLLYVCAFISAVWIGGRVNEAGRLFVFFLIFYSIAPFFPFDGFDFFSYEIRYSWNYKIFLVYATFLFAASLMTLVISNGFDGWSEGQVADCRSGLRFIWFVSLFAWSVDVLFNWPFFFLPKDEFILSLPFQTKNLFFFTIPARELLVGAWLLSPFRGEMKKVCVAVGVLALLHSLMLGYRHLALLLILLVLLPRVRSWGMLGLCVFFTFVGEVSNSVKILLVESSARDFLFSTDWWAQQLSVVSGVSGEQKAILSNLLVKLERPEFFEFGRFFEDLALGLPVINHFDFGALPATVGMSSIMGVPEGQGTGYSIHLAMLESLFVVLPVVAVVILLAQWLRGSMLAILSGELIYSMMRNSVDYWISQMAKLVFLAVVVLVVNEVCRLCRSRLFVCQAFPKSQLSGCCNDHKK